jgi:hypothetical protein
MPKPPELKAKDFVRDLRAGMSPLGLMAKYRLSRKQYDAALKQLQDAGLLKLADLVQAEHIPSKSFDEVDLELEYVRRFPRYSPGTLVIHVRDLDDPKAKGTVVDVSEDGVAVKGIVAKEGQVKALLLVPDESLALIPVAFDGECRWRKRDVKNRADIAGFEIILISDEDFAQLKTLLKVLTTRGTPADW